MRALVFDLDDTLFPEHSFVYSGFKAVDIHLRAQHGIQGFSPAAAALFESGQRGNIFDQALLQLGHPAPAELVQSLVAVYRSHLPEIGLHEDARWALEHFKGRLKLGLITDGYLETQRRKVEALGIAPYFDAIVFSDAHGRENWKPSPVPYERCMETLGMTGPECVYVGDNPKKDFVTAKRLGWRTFQVSRAGGEYVGMIPEESHRADAQLASLYELEHLIP